MNIKLTEQNFKNLVSYWAGKLRLPLPLFRRDNRIRFVGHVYHCKHHKVYNFSYNFNLIKTYSEAVLANVIFHELGHIKDYKIIKDTKDRVKSEYLAERFALDCIKKYYSDYLDEVIENTKELLKDKKWCKDFPIYVKAFEKIKEYKEK